MAVRKLSISLDEEQAARATRLAEAQGLTLSAFIGRSLEDQLILADGRLAMQEWEDEHGAFTPEELAEADAFVDSLGIPRRPGHPA
jgi:predicted transcriptional regulator